MRRRGIDGAGSVQFLELLVEVVVEFGALDYGCVRLLELLAVQRHEYRLDVVDQLVNPGEVEEGAVHGLRARRVSR